MIGKALRVAKVEYLSFITDKRVYFMLFTFLFFAEDIFGKMNELVAETGYSLGALEPLILIFSDKIHALIIPVVFVAMLSDFPSNINSGYFMVSRISRVAWMLGELLYACFVGLTFIIFLFIGSLLWCSKYICWTSQWSPYMSRLYMEYPEQYQLNNQLFIKTEVLAQGLPVRVFLHSVGLMMLYVCFLAVLLILFKLIGLKRIGIFMASTVTILGAAVGTTESSLKWLFPINQAGFGTHFNIFYRQQEFMLGGSYVYFVVLIVVMLVIDIKLVKRYIITEEME